MRWTFMIALLALLGVPSLARAQAWAGLDRAASERLSKRVDEARRIRITVGEQRLVINQPRVSAKHVAGVESRVYLTEVRRIDFRGNLAAQGFGVGAVMGVISGAFGGVAFANFCPFGGSVLLSCRNPTIGQEVKAGLIGAAVGGAALGLVGALIGAAIPKWQKGYERPRERRWTALLTPNTVGLQLRF